jgi:hypothetical protein
VSHSDVARVVRYIANQEEHHRKLMYAEDGALRKPLKWLPVNVGAEDPQPEKAGENEMVDL